MASGRKTVVLTITLESKFFNTVYHTNLGRNVLKYARCFCADIYFLWAVEARNKKNQKKMEKQYYFGKCKIHFQWIKNFLFSL